MPRQRANIREIARLAKVSVAAVSYAMHGDPRSKLSESKRKEIQAICARLHYHPNENARRVFRKKSETIAFFFPPLVGNVYRTFVDQNFSYSLIGAQNELVRHGMDLLLVEATPSFVREKRYLRLCRGGLIDGALLWGTLEDDSYVEELCGENLPMVMLQSDLGNTLSVTCGDYSGVRMLTEHVLRAGHRKIAVVSPLMSSYYARRFLGGIADALAEAGLHPRHVTGASGFDDTVAEPAVAEILECAADATCIMAPNDIVAFGCIRALRKRGIRVPGDISITGGAATFSSVDEFRLDAFRIPSREIGAVGARLLCDLIAGKESLKSIELPVEPVAGDSVAVPGSGRKAAALRRVSRVKTF